MLRSLRLAFERTLTAFVILLLGSLAVIVLMGVAYRKLGRLEDARRAYASIALAWLTYYGAGLAALKRSHIGFPGLVNAMPPHLRVPLVLLGEGIVILFFALLGWFGYEVLVILEGDAMVSLPWVPTRVTQSVIPIGSLVFIVAQLLTLPELLRQARGEGVIDAEKQEMQREIEKAMQS